MIPRAQLAAERRMLAGFLPPSVFRAPPEDPVARMRRMWRERRSVALIAICTGFEPQDIRDECRDIARPSIPVLLAGRSIIREELRA